MSMSGGGDRYGGGGVGGSGHRRDRYAGGGGRGSGSPHPHDRYGGRRGGGSGSGHGRDCDSGGGGYVDGDRSHPRDRSGGGDRYGAGGGGGDGSGHPRDRYSGSALYGRGGGYTSDCGPPTCSRRYDRLASKEQGRDNFYSGGSGSKFADAPRNNDHPLAGMRFILVGFGSPLKAEYKQWINGMGGQVLTSLEYEIATHIVPMGEREGAAIVWELDGKRVYSKEWLDSLLYVRPKALEVSSTGRTRNGSQALYPGERRVRRKIDFDSDHDNGAALCSKHHNIFKCPFDGSTQTTLLQFAKTNRKNLIDAGPTPGSDNKHWSIVGSTEIKLKLRRAFRLIQSMHKENMSLCGKFGAENFFYDDDNNARIGNLMEGNVKYGANLNDKNLDYHSFVKMVKKEVFVRTSIPNGISEWLSLMSSGVKGFEYLLCHHDGLMEPRQSASSFMSLHDIFLEIETTDPAAYMSVLNDLREYNAWIKRIPNNSFLKSTEDYRDKHGNKIEYMDDVKGLLRFLRNCRRHAAQFMEDEFPSIVGHFFPRLMCDLQKAMFKVGRLQQLNLEAAML